MKTKWLLADVETGDVWIADGPEFVRDVNQSDEEITETDEPVEAFLQAIPHYEAIPLTPRIKERLSKVVRDGL